MGATQSGCVINYEHSWVHCAPHAPLPPSAVVGGHDCDGSPIYVGRTYHEGDQLPAKVVPSKGCAYVSWSGEEHAKSHYEVLVGHHFAWVTCHGGTVPPNAVRSGHARGGEPLYVGRGRHANSLTVGKIHPSHGCLYIPFGGREVRVDTYEVLVHERRDQWVASAPTYTPAGAVVAGHDTDGAPIYAGRATHEAPSWVPSHAHSALPPHAVVGGNDVDGAVMYVGRAVHDGDMLVAKVIPSKGVAYVSWRGQELAKHNFEVLCGQSLRWRSCYGHVVPENAVSCGNTALGQRVYVGRGHFEGSLTVGRVSSVHRALFIPFGGTERRLESYEILVEEQRETGWCVPNDAKPLPPVETKHPVYPAIPQPLPCRSPPHYAPSRPPPPPYEAAPPTLGPAYPTDVRAQDTWVNAGPSYTPRNAVQGGHDCDMSTILVCRAFHNGDLIPGKAVPSRARAYVSSAGHEVPKSDYEVLVGDDYQWAPSSNGGVPPGAVAAGRTADGEPLFVGRAHYAGSLTPGKVQRSHQCLYIAFGGCERRIPHYEVLVRRSDYCHDHHVRMHC